MIGGGMRAVTQHDRRAWLLLCRQHHEEFQDRGKTPYEVQFAWKLQSDPVYWDLEWLMRVGGWADGFITQEQVREIRNGDQVEGRLLLSGEQATCWCNQTGRQSGQASGT